MKYFLLFLLISISSYSQISVNRIDEENLRQGYYTSCAPKIKAVELNIFKEKSEVQIGSEANFSLEIRALHSVKKITVLLNFSKKYKKDDKTKEIKIDNIDSGKVEVIPISTLLSERSFQSIRIEVKGKFRNPITKTDVDFNTGEDVGMIYNELTNSFNIETSVEAMTKAYRIWNLVPEDTLLARGYNLSINNFSPDTSFRQAEPVEPKTKRRKSLNHDALFTELSSDSDTLDNLQLNKTNNTESQVCVNVQGTIYYQDYSGQILPLPNLTVEIWEDDTFWDDFLTSTTTDQNGHFSINLCDDDGLFDSHLELYAIFATINSRVGVLNYTQPGGPNGFNPFSWSTWIVETGGGTVNYGNLYIMGNNLNRQGAKIFDNMQKAWSASVARGFNPSYTPTVYPFDCAGTSFYAFSGWTNPFAGCDLSTWGTGLGAIYLESEEWLNGNEDVSYHEYGHALMHRAYSNAWYPNTDGGDHEIFPQPAGFAWSEGWATFYTQVVNNDGNYNGWANLENKNYIPYSSITGEVSEWRVAQAMVDLYDTNVDGNDYGSIAYNKFISTMQSNNSGSLTQFWGQLRNILTAWEKYYGSMSLIYNTIPVSQDPYPVLSVSISGPTYLSVAQSGTWTTTASGGTPPYHYQWSYYYPCDEPYLMKMPLPLAPPCGYWWNVGSDSYQLTRSDSKSFELKCKVTDAVNSTATSNILFITVGGSLAKIADTPLSYSLEQNHPNPFNPVTTISYQIKEQGLVQLKVYNLLGQEIVTLVNEYQPAGIYEALFDASNLPSGVYIYSIRVNDFVQNNKMTLLK